MIGIYCIYWLNEDLYYIGQSSKINTRIKAHFNNLKNNKHSNYKMQKAYNSYGDPEIHILETCSIEELNTKELFWQKEFNSLSSLDIVEAGIHHASGLSNPRSKYNKLQILLVFRLCRNINLTAKNISEVTEVSLPMVYDILSGRAHKWLHERYKYSWNLINSRRNDRLKVGYTKSANRLNKSVELLSPVGEVFTVDNFVLFGKEHNLDPSDLSRVTSGKYKHTKGWKLNVLS